MQLKQAATMLLHDSHQAFEFYSLIIDLFQHKEKKIDGFTKQYGVHTLVYYETYEDVYEAMHREKAIKKWRRAWKINLIESNNPQWLDLYYELT